MPLKFIHQYICILCASFLLVGCSYFDTGAAGPQTSMPQDMAGYEISNEPIDITKVTEEYTEGSVQIFPVGENAQEPLRVSASSDLSLNEAEAMEMQYVEPVPAVAPYGIHSGSFSSSVFSSDPSVQVFSLDDPIPYEAGPLTPMGHVSAPLMHHQPAREEYVNIGVDGSDKVVIYFGHDSTRLGQNDIQKIRAVANSFNSAARQGLTVEGHSSVMANYQNEEQRHIVNLKISLDRAYAVSSALIESGVPADAIRVIGWGDARPPRDLHGKSLESASRRVEISS